MYQKSIKRALTGLILIAGWTQFLPACGFTNLSANSKDKNPTPKLEKLQTAISIENLDLKRIDEFSRNLEIRWNTPGHFEKVMAMPIEKYFPDPQEFLTNNPVDFFGYTFEGMLDVLTNAEAIEARLSKLASFNTVGDYFANDGISSVADIGFTDFDVLVENTIKDFEAMQNPDSSEISDEEIDRAISQIDFTSESSVLYLDAPLGSSMIPKAVKNAMDDRVANKCQEETQGLGEKATEFCINKVMDYSRESCRHIHRDYNSEKAKCDADPKSFDCINVKLIQGGNERRQCLNNDF